MPVIHLLVCTSNADPGTIFPGREAAMPLVSSKMATIECSTCSTLLEVYPQDEPGKPNLCWTALDDDQCKAPPISRCPYARDEVKRRFAVFDG
jgi:hypothetical protein